MPFTPFHFGPAALIKAAIPRYFSFSIFCLAQVMTDVEVLFYMARGEIWIHRWAHTSLGALGMAALAALVGKPACEAFLRWWKSRDDVPLKEYFNPDPRITWIAAWNGSLLGTFSHVALDCIVHADVRPLWPFAQGNPCFGLVSEGIIYGVCFALGAIGAILCGTVARHKL